jgi:serine/threonine-protein kinase HipA
MAPPSVQRYLDVLLGAAVVGQLRYTQDGRREHTSFQYSDEWLAMPTRYPIDPTLPLVSGPQFPPHAKAECASRFHGAIADTEPDGWARSVIQRDHAKRRQIATARGDVIAPVLTALDYLLAVDDHSRVGALQYRDEAGVLQRAHEPQRRTAPPLLELPDLFQASRAVERHTETFADLEYLRGRATSLGGMRPKCSVRDERWGLCLGKFPSVNDDRACTKGEVLALHLARRAGINAADARLVDSDGVPVALIRRFDRAIDTVTGLERRVLFVSAATMLSLPSGEAGEHAYTEIADVIRQRSLHAAADLEELWRRVAFSILITNVDDHLHNHAFLHVDGMFWALSPAFDMNPFPGRARELKTWISEEAGPAASIEALLGTAAYFGLPKPRAAAVLGEVERAVATWREVAANLGFTDAEADAFADAFEHEERAIAQRAMR